MVCWYKGAVRRSRSAIVPVVALTLCACVAGSAPSRSDGGSAGRTTAASVTPSVAASGRVVVRSEVVARLEAPVAMAVRMGDAAIYIAGQRGRITAIRGDAVRS